MSDRYLFRGKRADNMEWVEGIYLFIRGRTFILLNSSGYSRTAFMDEDIFEVIPETVGQWTGLEDRNGKKIFEGDIVEYSQTDNFGGEQGTAVVYWCDKCVGFRPFSNDNEVDGRTWDYIIKLGNIHENPELLEGA